MDAVLERLRAIVGDAHVLVSVEDRASYQRDWRGRYQGDALCVVRPGSVEEVSAVVCACAEHGCPIVPQGGNTSHVGGSVPLGTGREVIVSTSRMNRILAVDAPNNTITVQAGCTLAAVQEAAQAVERLFPLSLASEGSCQIGGNLASNAGGVHVLRYGNMRDLVLGIEAVLPDGRIWNGLRGLRKDNTGYDLKHLFVGSEGTLGIITAAVLKLFPQPRSRAVAWVAVPDAQTALDLLGLVASRAAEHLSAFEIIDASAFELILKHIPQAKSPLSSVSPWYALIELADSNATSTLQVLLEDILATALEKAWVTDAVLAASQAQIEALWALRESAADAQKIEGISIKHDISLPVSRIPEFLQAAEQALTEHFGKIRIVAFGHAGDGNLHYNLSRYEAERNAEFIARTPEANRIVYDIVASFGGSISAEHGLGQLKREEICRYKSEVELDIMRSIKRVLDPAGIMNPGKLL
ncbi:FAD-binding oxidoreductase [Uliginosibacterium gangwonense]|uniref:FAD-binding oxidoreductase n=1 Tax=Uliginosibacterium gangwonense TaxID=392736 RepID=UPI00036FEF85|nr:FAD-binding oxidoreductase [Uliginosibacterium gangwonense]